MSRSSGPSKRLSAQAKVQRDSRIVADRALGLRWQTIADRHGLTARQCQSIWRAYQADAVEVEEPLRAVDDILGQIEAAIEDAALLAERTANDSVRLGAINTRLKALSQKLAFMQACGLLPRDLGLVRNELAMSEGINRVLDFLTRFNLTAEDYRELQTLMYETSIWRTRGLPEREGIRPGRSDDAGSSSATRRGQVIELNAATVETR